VCARAGAASVAWGKVHSSSELPSNLLKPFKRRMFRGFDLVVVYGERSRAELLDLGVAAKQIYVAQNTIDTDHIFEHAETLAVEGARLRARHGLEGARILLSVGRLEADKRQHDLLAAWPRLRAADPRLHLVIVGGGPLLADIRERGAALDAEHILVTGRVPVGEDYGWMAAADATIQCGAVGLALNQSMALGKPTIIADEIGSDTEILVHGETGWRYPRGDIDRLVETVTAVLRRDDATARVKARARTLLRDRVNISNMATNLRYCIDHALAMSSTRRNSS